MRQLRVNKCKLHRLSKWLRNEVNKSGWYKKSKRCYVTGSAKNLEMHHDGVSFSQIVRDSFKSLGIKYCGEYTENYSTTDLILLKNEVIRRHNLYARAVTLASDVHLELHRIYGSDVSHEQLEEFKARYNKMEAIA